MKHYNQVFDIFFYEGIFLFLFSWLLLLLDDRFTEIFFKISITALVTAGVLWVIGYFFNLFVKEDLYEES